MVHAGVRACRGASVAVLRLRAHPVRNDRPFLTGALLGLVANLAGYGYVWASLGRVPQLLPLHYNGGGYVDQVGAAADLFRLPAIGTLVLLANLALALTLHERERPAAHVLLWTAVAVQMVLGSGVWVLIDKAAG
jgi:hypothetical protein